MTECFFFYEVFLKMVKVTTIYAARRPGFGPYNIGRRFYGYYGGAPVVETKTTAKKPTRHRERLRRLAANLKKFVKGTRDVLMSIVPGQNDEEKKALISNVVKNVAWQAIKSPVAPPSEIPPPPESPLEAVVAAVAPAVAAVAPTVAAVAPAVAAVAPTVADVAPAVIPVAPPAPPPPAPYTAPKIVIAKPSPKQGVPVSESDDLMEALRNKLAARRGSLKGGDIIDMWTGAGEIPSMKYYDDAALYGGVIPLEYVYDDAAMYGGAVRGGDYVYELGDMYDPPSDDSDWEI